MSVEDGAIRAAILGLVAARGPGRTICPSEAAKALGADWRPLMPAVRRVADALCAEGRIEITQRGRPVGAQTARGPIRLGLRGQPG